MVDPKKGDFWFRLTPDAFDPVSGDTGVYLEIFSHDANPFSGWVPLGKVKMLSRVFREAAEETIKLREKREEKIA